jgi:hypothetical protein
LPFVQTGVVTQDQHRLTLPTGKLQKMRSIEGFELWRASL